MTPPIGRFGRRVKAAGREANQKGGVGGLPPSQIGRSADPAAILLVIWCRASYILALAGGLPRAARQDRCPDVHVVDGRRASGSRRIARMLARAPRLSCGTREAIACASAGCRTLVGTAREGR